MVVRCLFGGCTVHKEQNIRWGRCLYGACLVLVRCFHDQDYSKEEQQTNQLIGMVLSNKKAALE